MLHPQSSLQDENLKMFPAAQSPAASVAASQHLFLAEADEVAECFILILNTGGPCAEVIGDALDTS